jgi:hypothetical protein
MQASTVSPRSSIVYILIDKDPSTGAWKPSPDPAVVYSDQLVEWVALDPTLKIKIQWKNVGFDPPCNEAARRCGRKSYHVDQRTEARYAVRILGPDNIELAFIDPILDILPVVEPVP